MAPKKYKRKNGLTPTEQKTTAAFKLISEKASTLEKSLKCTQDELEKYRDKYHEADKTNAVQNSRNRTLVFHEILKFIVSVVCGGVGVNLVTGGKIWTGAGIIFVGIIIYSVIVVSDRYKD